MPDARTSHPYHMYEAIRAQPLLIENVLGRRSEIEKIADAVAKKDRITFVGIGTSLHAARICENWMRELTAGRLPAHVEQSFELLHHPIAFGPSDAVIVITHTGTSSASVEALKRAQAAGALTVAITGENCGEGARIADLRIETCDQEKAFAYTKSYATALAALALMIIRIAEQKKLLAKPGASEQLARVPNWILEALDLEPLVKSLARDRAASASRNFRLRSGVGYCLRSGTENQRSRLHRRRRIRHRRNSSRPILRNRFARGVDRTFHRRAVRRSRPPDTSRRRRTGRHPRRNRHTQRQS